MCWISASAPGFEKHPHIPSLGRAGAGRWDFILPERGYRTGRLCSVMYCRRLAHQDGRSRVCHKCRKTRWRVNNPLASSFADMRSAARKRKVEFSLTLEWYRDFALRTGYADGKGIHRGDLHIDRIDALKGYTPDNVRVLEAGENCTKGAGFDKARWAAHRRGEAEPDPF